MYFLSKYNAIIDRNTKLARNATELPPKTKAYTNVAIEGVRLMSKALIKWFWIKNLPIPAAIRLASIMPIPINARILIPSEKNVITDNAIVPTKTIR